MVWEDGWRSPRGEVVTYTALRSKLEENEMLDLGFKFWDVEDRRCMKKIECSNDISFNVRVILS